jgi:hypothetical protein
MADPQVIQCASQCTVTVVHEISLPPLQLTAAEGGQIVLAIGTVWAVAFGFRMVARVLSTGDGNQPTEGN